MLKQLSKACALLWRIIENLSTLSWLASFFTLPAVLFAALTALFWAAWSFLWKLPIPIIFLSFFVAFMTVLLCLNLILAAYERIASISRNAARRQHAMFPLPWSHLGDTREITHSNVAEEVREYDSMLVVRRAASTPFTLTLPGNPAPGRIIDIAKAFDDKSSQFIVEGNGRTIVGQPTYVMPFPAQSITVRFSGVEWVIL